MWSNGIKACILALAVAGASVAQSQSVGTSAPVTVAASPVPTSMVLATLGPNSATLAPPRLLAPGAATLSDAGNGLIDSTPGAWTSVAIGVFLIAAVMRRRIKSMIG